MRKIFTTILLLLCLSIFGACAALDWGADAGTKLGVLDKTETRTLVVDAEGVPILDEQGRQQVDVVTVYTPGPVVRNATEDLGGIWGTLAGGALTILTGLMGAYAIRKRRESIEADAATALAVRAVNEASATGNVKAEVKRAVPDGNDPRRKRLSTIAAKQAA